jgi:hypothetical protein
MLRKRRQLFEFADLPWVKGWLREGMFEYMNFLLYRMTQPYEGVERVLVTWALEAGEDVVLDLGSGGGGHVDWLFRRAKQLGLGLPRFVLSDLFPAPNIGSYKWIQARHGTHNVTYLSDPVDACTPPKTPCRLRSMFSIFHHLTPDQARRMLASACSDSDGILIAEGVRRALTPAIMMVLLLPAYMFLMPFAAPHFTVRRLLFSTLIPVIPLMMAFDGVASVLRAYTADEIVSFFPQSAQGEFEIKTYTFRFLAGIFATTVVTARRKKGKTF